MNILNIQYGDAYYAIVDGVDMKFTGGDGSEDEERAVPPCSQCSKQYATDSDGEVTRVVYQGWTLSARTKTYEEPTDVFLCSECLNRAKPPKSPPVQPGTTICKSCRLAPSCDQSSPGDLGVLHGSCYHAIPDNPPTAHSDATDQACDGMPPVSSCTPGPWGCQHGGNICRIWGVGSAPLNFPVATCSRVEGESVDTHQANAQLIADACNSYQKNCGPRAAECARDDLLGEALDVCEAMVAALESVVPTMVVRAAIHYGEALLGKATGEADDPTTAEFWGTHEETVPEAGEGGAT